MANGINRNTSPFLSYLPPLKDTPPESLSFPTDFDEVTVRISSEECPIMNSSRIKGLYQLRDDVYVTKYVNFHWNFNDIAEGTLNEARWSQGPMADSDIIPDNADDDLAQATYNSYDVARIIAMRPKREDDELRFWVGKSIDVHRGKEGIAKHCSG